MRCLHDLILKHKISLAVAESFTSGLISSNITTYPGSSKYFKGGIVAYQNSVKVDLLSVPNNLIKVKTEVSKEVAEEMARNVLSLFNSDFAVATTGYAGPVGGNNNIPIGTFFIAISDKNNCISKKFFLKEDRKTITKYAVKESLSLLYHHIKKSI